MSKTDVLLIYPQLGSFDDLVRDIPLSLIYAASASVKAGFRVRIVDLRLSGGDWRAVVDPILEAGCGLVGLSVMTGNPIKISLAISRYVRERYGVPVVWGGAHPTVLPEQTLSHPDVDYVVRDWGSEALCGLLRHLTAGAPAKAEIAGLGWKEGGKPVLAAPQTGFERVDYRDLPYGLVDISGANYNRMKNGELIFPLFTSMGCPYKCSFCMSPAVYGKIRGKKWVPYAVSEVLEHIAYLSERYDFKRLQVYDDESFVDLARMRDLLTGYIERGYADRYKLDFRGLRIDHLDEMDESFLALLVRANVEILCIGLESGSDRVLGLMKKGITVEQILRANRKIAKYPSLKPHYNFFSGIPGETLDDLLQTKSVLLRVVADHPGCYLGFGAHWKPIPGSLFAEVAVREYGLELPTSLEGWAEVDSFDAGAPWYPWYTRKFADMVDLLAMAGTFLDAKIGDMVGELGPVLGGAVRMGAFLYRPILRLRLRWNFTGFFVERAVRIFFVRHVGRMIGWTRRRG